MESFFLTGQKRVGKTSLALACIEFAKAHQSEREIVSSYNLWGSFAHVNPAASLESLGLQIEKLIRESVPGFLNHPLADFRGHWPRSLASQIWLIKCRQKRDSSL